jgi:hypothetical protein
LDYCDLIARVYSHLVLAFCETVSQSKTASSAPIHLSKIRRSLIYSITTQSTTTYSIIKVSSKPYYERLSRGIALFKRRVKLSLVTRDVLVYLVVYR